MINSYRRIVSIVGLVFVLYVFYSITPPPSPARHVGVNPSKPRPSFKRVTTVVASQTKDNTTWLPAAFPEWDHQIYITNDRNAPLTVPMNKGREAMVYLTYIIDHYDSLPPVVLFHHAKRYQWHVDDPLYDGIRSLQRLQLPYIMKKGYVNLRCVWTLGCPAEIHPFEEAGGQVPGNPKDKDESTGAYFKAAFEELFPEYPVPTAVGVSCCAEFAVTARKIQERPKADYERYREWLMSTELSDDVSGRVMEYSWHVVFGQPAVYCPDAKECYCNVFGLCNLTCEEQGVCKSQYTLPPYADLPNGWPDYGWDGEWQNATEM